MPFVAVLRRAVGAVSLASVAVLVALPAWAHSELVASDPEDGATVAELTTIHLEFSEDLLEIGNSVVVTDGAGIQHEAELTFPQPSQIDATVSDVAPGDAVIAWRNASVDGHTEEGELHVTVVPPSPSPSASPTPTVTVTATASPTPSATPSVSPTADEAGDSGSGVSPWVWGLVGLVVLGGIAAALFAATRRPPAGRE